MLKNPMYVQFWINHLKWKSTESAAFSLTGKLGTVASRPVVNRTLSFTGIMDIRKWSKNPPTVTSAKSDKPTPPDVVSGGEVQQCEPEPASSSAEPHPGTSNTADATTSNRSSAIATGAVFGPQLPAGSVSVSDLGTDKPKQVVLKKRSFSSSWYFSRTWLEYYWLLWTQRPRIIYWTHQRSPLYLN